MKLMRIITIIVLLTGSLGQLNRLFIGDADNIVLYANDLVMGLLAIWYVAYVLVSRKSWKIPPVMMGFWFWMVVGSIGLLAGYTVLTKTELGISLSYLVRYASYLTLFFVAYDSVHYDSAPAWIRKWSVVLLITSVLVAISGYIQLFMLPDLAVLTKYGWDPHVNRLVTSMLDPNFAGCYLSIGAGLAASLYLFSKNLFHQTMLLVVLAILTVAILLTYSRSGYLMLGIVFSIIAVVKSRWMLVVGVILAVMAVAFVPRAQERIQGALQGDATTSARELSWEHSLTIAQTNLVTGVGFNSYRYAQDRYGILDLDQSGNAGAGADSSWLFILATTGVVGLLFYAASFVSLGWLGWKAYLASHDPAAKAMSLAFVAVVVGLGVASQFNNALFYTWILELFWVMAGLVVAISEKFRPSQTLATT